MTTLTTLTEQPNSTLQAGSWTVVPSGTASSVLSDGSDSTYVQLTAGICRLDSQVCRVGFATPSLPAGAKIYSVALRHRVLAVSSSGNVPTCYHWFRTNAGTIVVSGQQVLPQKQFYSSTCPTTSSAPTWTTETIVSATTAPGGQPWTIANLTGFAYDLGRGDSNTTPPLQVSEVFLDITYQQLSTVTVSGPTGTIPDTQPTVKWVYASPDSQPQQAFQVAVYALAQTLAGGFQAFVTSPIQGTNGFVLGEAQQWTCTSDLTDGQYVAYVQAQSQWGGPGTFNTAAASTSWTRQAFIPAAPTASGPPLAAVLNSATFDSTNNRVALNFQPGTQPTISAVGAAATGGGAGTTTLAVNPTAVGDVLVLATNLTSTSLSVSAVSGGGVSSWQQAASSFVGSGSTVGMWMGTVTTAGSSTITITGSGSLASTTVRLISQQFTSTLGSSTQWAIAVTASGLTSLSSTTVTYPTIVPDGTKQAYVGYAETAQTSSTLGATSGYTVQLDNGNNALIYNPNVTGAQSPTSAQSPTGVSSAVAFLLTAGEPTAAFTVRASRNGGATYAAIPSLTYLAANGLSAITAYDYVAPLNIASLYEVVAYAGSPYVAATNPSNVLSVTPTGDRHWLKSPSNPLLNTVLPVAAPDQPDAGIKITKRRMQGTFQLLSGTNSEVLPFVVSGPTYGDEYEITLIFIAGDPVSPMTLWAPVDQLDNSGETLLFQKPDGTQLWVVTGPGASGTDTTEVYNSLAGDATTTLFRRRKLVMTETGAPSFY